MGIGGGGHRQTDGQSQVVPLVGRENRTQLEPVGLIGVLFCGVGVCGVNGKVSLIGQLLDDHLHGLPGGGELATSGALSHEIALCLERVIGEGDQLEGELQRAFIFLIRFHFSTFGAGDHLTEGRGGQGETGLQLQRLVVNFDVVVVVVGVGVCWWW